MAAADDLIVGIDLGTTNSLVAVWEPGGARVIEDDAGRPLLPSVVRYERAGGELRAIVGHGARHEAPRHPRTTVSSVKRLMGRSLDDARPDLPHLPYEVVEGAGRTARVRLPLEGGEVVVSPQEVSARILGALRERASRALGVDVRRAVVTVPAYFDDAQRQATRDAGRLAGIDVVRIVNEPTAAALAYGLGVGAAARATRHVAVYDLGGGTFDISILRLTPQEGSGTAFFQVLSTAGDTHLGGDDVDQMLAARLIDAARREGLLDTKEAPPTVRAHALRAAESAKIELSGRDQTIARLTIGDRTLDLPLTRAEFERTIAPWVERSVAACERALRDARRAMAGAPIDAVVMVGGSTRIPFVRARVRDLFDLDPYTAVDPDRVVALGAAVQAGILSGRAEGALLLDVIPLSLGIETMGGAVAKLVMRNSTVPARAREMFSTSVDGQTSIALHVLQGEREMASDCRSLGRFHLSGIPPMPAGIPQVEVEFLVDASGVLNVSAVERRSGRRAGVQIVPNHGLTREEVDRMASEAFANARDDMTRHRIVDLVASAALDLKWIGERLAQLGPRLEPGYRDALSARAKSLEAMVARARNDWRSVDPDELHAAKEALDRESVRLMELAIAESLRREGDGGPG